MNRRLPLPGSRRGLRVAVGVVAIMSAVPAATAKPVYGSVSPESSPASDAFAAAHLALVASVFLGFAAFAWVLYRRSRAPNREREFIEELQAGEERNRTDKERRRAGSEAEEAREPWEKSGDWWKKGS